MNRDGAMSLQQRRSSFTFHQLGDDSPSNDMSGKRAASSYHGFVAPMRLSRMESNYAGGDGFPDARRDSVGDGFYRDADTVAWTLPTNSGGRLTRSILRGESIRSGLGDSGSGPSSMGSADAMSGRYLSQRSSQVAASMSLFKSTSFSDDLIASTVPLTSLKHSSRDLAAAKNMVASRKLQLRRYVFDCFHHCE